MSWALAAAAEQGSGFPGQMASRWCGSREAPMLIPAWHGTHPVPTAQNKHSSLPARSHRSSRGLLAKTWARCWSIDPRGGAGGRGPRVACSLRCWVLTCSLHRGLLPPGLCPGHSFCLAGSSPPTTRLAASQPRHPLQGGLLQRNPTRPKTLSHRGSQSGLMSGSPAELQSKYQHLGPRQAKDDSLGGCHSRGPRSAGHTSA